MKTSNSKKQLAKIISENGGWRDGEFAAQDGDGTGSIDFFKSKPQYYPSSKFWRGVYDPSERIVRADVTIKNFHQTILSRDEYFHLYPAPDADGWIEWRGGECPVEKEVVVEVYLRKGRPSLDGPKKASRWDWSVDGHAGDIVKYRLHKPSEINNLTQVGDTDVVESKPTIEQLASEYRNRRDYAERKQQEADAAKVEAEAKLAELVAAGKALGLAVSVAAPEPELVITDWRDLREGDVIRCVGDAWDDDFEGSEAVVTGIESHDYRYEHRIRARIGEESDWGAYFHFIRRPSKGANNA